MSPKQIKISRGLYEDTHMGKGEMALGNKGKVNWHCLLNIQNILA